MYEPGRSGVGRSIVLFSPRGGTGTTTIAVAVATWLAAFAPGRSTVALLDFTFPFGNAAASMGLTPVASLGDADPQLTEASMRSLFTPSQLGVNVLACPLDPMIAEGIGADECSTALRYATGVHDFTVVDIGSSLSEAGLDAIEAADAVLIVTTGDPHGLYSTAASLHTLTLLGVSAHRVMVVANRLGEPHRLDRDAISTALGHPSLRCVPETDDLALAASKGKLLVRDWPDHPWSMAVGHIAELCLAATAAPAEPSPVAIPAGHGLEPTIYPVAAPQSTGSRWSWRRKRSTGPIGPPSALIGGSSIG